MDETNKTNGAGAQPLLQVIRGVLQFVGGGLLALHEEQPAVKPESLGDRAVRERLAGMGMKTDHAERVRRAWQSATPSPASPSPAASTEIPRFSFEEFAAAMATLETAPCGASDPQETTTRPEEHAIVATSEPERAPTISSSSPLPRSFEELAAMAPPVRDGAGPAQNSKDDGKAGVERRFEQLEARLAQLQQRLADAMDEFPSPNGMGTAVTAQQTSTGRSVEPPCDKNSLQRVTTIFDGVPITLGPRGGEDSRVVQGPWMANSAGHDGPEPPGGERPGTGDAYHAHEQRVTALEDTFGQLERMVEGLAAKSRGKGQPPS